jgi:hypothetical protein
MICEFGGICVYDQNGFIGVLADSVSAVLVRKLDGGQTYAISFEPETGVPASLELVYPNTTCAAPPYISLSGMFPTPAAADNNKVMWAATGPEVQITINSLWTPRGGCEVYRWSSGPTTVAAAAVVDTTVVKSWVPPFTPNPPPRTR